MKVNTPGVFLAIACFCLQAAGLAQNSQEVWKTKRYTVYRDSIVQENKYVSKALSDEELVSNYKSPVNEFKNPEISFKFSINGKDNEMMSGVDHHFVCIPKNGYCETPLIHFGSQLNDRTSAPAGTYLAPGTKLKIRLDLRDVKKAFQTKGFYTNYKGERIYKEDFKGVYIAGSSSPMIWDFDNLVHHPDLMLKDDDGDGIYEVVLNMNAPADEKHTASVWKLSKDISSYPQYHSGFRMSNALYNMALEEMVRAIEPDSTFRTGKEWSGVWTRDISYSIILSMAYMQPKVAMNSLLRKVNKRKRIIQDTGTGGAWPASTDRMIWAVAAWEIYKATGDKDWLQQAYTIIRNSIEDDMQTDYDAQTGLVKGESSFLDWREQTYPKWMQPVDIAQSECLGTNAVHCQANFVLSQMAELLGKHEEAERHRRISENIKAGINKYLWQPAQQYYAQYLYGRNYMISSPRAEALGEALSVLFDIADDKKQKQIVQHTPVTDFGISCIYPQIPNTPPYHNNAVWPFVQSFWLLAATKAGNESSVMESISAIYRPAAMFATNKENFVAENGDFLGTQINSSNMLWSLSGSISIVHKVLFGIRYEVNGLYFQPFVPKALDGKRSLDHFRYRNAVLNIELEGYGNHIQSFQLDGQLVKEPKISSELTGTHQIRIILASGPFDKQGINHVANLVSPSMPEVSISNGVLRWNRPVHTKEFKILKNGHLYKTTSGLELKVDEGEFAEYQVIAIDDKGMESFASEPLPVVNKKWVALYESDDSATTQKYGYKGYSGKGFNFISQTVNRNLPVTVTIDQDGVYAIDFRYANGNGPTNTENKCAIRDLKADGKVCGTVLFPQRGKEEWSNWGFSNVVYVKLTKGKHVLSLNYEEWNENMNGEINDAVIDYMRLTLISKDQFTASR